MLRVGRRWQGDADEKDYIAAQAREAFTHNRALRDQKEIDAALNLAHARIHNARTHGIAYDKLGNSTSGGGGDVKIIPKELREEVGVFASVGLPANEANSAERKKAREKRRNAAAAAARVEVVKLSNED